MVGAQAAVEVDPVAEQRLLWFLNTYHVEDRIKADLDPFQIILER